MPISLGTTTVTALFLGTTSITSAYLGATQVFGGSFTPLSLFSGGSQGIWLDPSDLSTMFSDRAGTTPVTAPGTVVGLRLDKSKGLVLGAELVTNGTFDTDLSGWTVAAASTGSSSWVAGSMQIAYSSALPAARYQALSVTAGKTYNLKCVYSVVSGTAVKFFLTVKDTTSVTSSALAEALVTASSGASGSISFYYTAASTRTVYVMGLIYDVAGTINFDNISVRELAGNHAVAPTDAARPIYGIEPKGGRRNLLTYSELLSNAVWTQNNATLGASDTAPSGAVTQKIVENTATTTHGVSFVYNFGVTSNAVTISFYAKAAGRSAVHLSFINTDQYATFNLSSGVATRSGYFATASIVDLGSGWYRCIATTVPFDASRTISVFVNSLTAYAGDGSSGVQFGGAQLELGSTASNYQKVTTAYDITESGVATCHYVQYDGSDDSMSTAAIDFTATDKMSVFAGVRKSGSDGIMLELGPDVNNNAGSFAMYPGAYGVGGSEYAFVSGGTQRRSIDYEAGVSVPYYGLMTGLGDISGDLNRLRINGTQIGQVITDQGTGNFGNYPLFIGRRNNATLPFNGRDYGILVVGKAATSTEITDTETWLAAKTSGVTI